MVMNALLPGSGPRPADPTPGSAGFQPASGSAGSHPPPGSAGFQPASHSAGVRPTSGSAGLQPASGSAGAHPTSGSAGLQPASDSVGVPPAPGNWSKQAAPTLDASQRATAPQSNHTPHRLTQHVAEALARRGEALAVGETAAGGALNTLLNAADAPGKWIRGGLIVYAGSDVPLVRSIQDVASAYGIVSEEYVAALAGFVRRTFGCDWALAESGIAGPQTGRRSAKPAGMVCLAVAGPAGGGAQAKERGASPRATGDMLAGEGQVWATTRVLVDSGRNANQRQFAVEALRFFQHVLAAFEREQERLHV